MGNGTRLRLGGAGRPFARAHQGASTVSTNPAAEPAPSTDLAPQAEPGGDQARGRSPWLRLAVAVGVGLLVGFLTSFGQGLLPEVLSPLANSAGSWSLVALLLASLSPRRGFAVAIGVLSLLAMVAGYDLASLLRGFGVSLGGSLFWVTAAVVVGPFLGLGSHALRVRNRLAPVAVGAMSGVLVGEGAYGLTVIAATTPAGYWTASIVVGVAFLAWAVVRRFPRLLPALAAAGITTLVAASFHTVYSLDLISWFISALLS